MLRFIWLSLELVWWDAWKKRLLQSSEDPMPAPVRHDRILANPHPNEVDCKRIERALRARKRYRYVEPRVLPAADGYHIESPCCSRNVDREGGVIDIASLQYFPQRELWGLFRKDHARGCWVPWGEFPGLGQALELLNHDPQRTFWP